MNSTSKRRIMFASIALLVLGVFATACDPRDQLLVARAIEERQAVQTHPFLVCVRHHESDRDGPYPYTRGYFAKNPRSTASGAYQFLDSTWRTVANRAGFGAYAGSPARYAPDWVQDHVALWFYQNGGRSAWNGSGC